MTTVAPDEIQRLLALPRLKTREHPQRHSKIQYKYLDNAGHWRWGPRSARRAPSVRCFQCGEETTFVQDGDGRVYSVCEKCSDRYVEWSPSLAYELKRDNGAGWRKAVQRTHRISSKEPKPGTKHIPLSQGRIAVISEEDYERVSQHKWHAVRKRERYWYAAAKVTIDGRPKTTYLHRFILDPPPDKVVDHIDHDGLNCTRGNMRVCTRQRNVRNRKWEWGPTEDAFIETLQVLIEEHTITGVAETAGVSRPTIYHLLQGKTKPQRKTLDKLTAAYPELAP